MGRIEHRTERKKVKRKKRLRTSFVIIVIIFLGIIGIGGYVALQTFQAASNSYNDLGREKSDKRDQVVSISKDPVSILIMGVEDYSSGGQNGRTDTLMVATFNPKDEKLKLLSIPRDTLVDIVGKDKQDKINHAHVFGGKEMTIDTVENFLDIPIDYYAAVNFESFKNIVDILGGITVDVPFDFQQNSDDRVAEKLQFYEGQMELDGRYALAYARMRKQDPLGDIGRNERQQQVVEAIIKKALSVGTITKIDDLAEEFGNNVETNMKVSEGLSFFTNYSKFRSSNIDKLVLKTDSQTINGVSYQIADEESLAEVQAELKKHLELKNSKVTVKKENEY
ncbi:LCP family protein [Ornithinibacillus bavariensis]|uniref:LytR family transcriptional regulator n=1 Tax=Ornithinibacillus bavariensis TaxID=545502 RepID=A0A919X7G4_9BACI|nr:LCP family protein [Ornithinibacillus bavariensis]GIO26926.1 LytR family transcriptional regulator [Ornithinibacillus bavariensis]